MVREWPLEASGTLAVIVTYFVLVARPGSQLYLLQAEQRIILEGTLGFVRAVGVFHGDTILYITVLWVVAYCLE